MTKVYAVSDIHGFLEPLNTELIEDGSILLIAGDICPDYSKDGRAQAQWLNGLFRVWLTKLVDRGIRVVATWGNHDFVGERYHINSDEFSELDDLPWTLLVDEEVTIDGVRIWGTPWVPNLPYWAFFGTPETLQARADEIPSGLDILMTHGPPYGAGDFVPGNRRQVRTYDDPRGQRVGEEQLVEALRRARPKKTVCGHIHEDRGSHVTDAKNLVYNVSAVDGQYDPYKNPIRELIF
jgi:Icc-related predicted phosphoesterase